MPEVEHCAFFDVLRVDPLLQQKLHDPSDPPPAIEDEAGWI